MDFSPLNVWWTILKSRGRVLLWAVVETVGGLAVPVVLPTHRGGDREPPTPGGGPIENYWDQNQELGDLHPRSGLESLDICVTLTPDVRVSSL